ncbi:hypothetical protein ACOSP7_025979 [Xanthoceras sorbifolium]
MVRSTSPEHGSGSPKRLTLGFLVSFMALCSKHASRVSSKLRAKPDSNHKTSSSPIRSTTSLPPKSPMRARPKQLITSISNKAIMFMHSKKKHGHDDKDEEDGFGGAHEEFGDGGVWQRDILMGDKCQPLDFSGVIYYDHSGKQLNEVPLRSPRASPLPGYLSRKIDL